MDKILPETLEFNHIIKGSNITKQKTKINLNDKYFEYILIKMNILNEELYDYLLFKCDYRNTSKEYKKELRDLLDTSMVNYFNNIK